MHPVVALLVAAAASKFGEAVGETLLKGLFGTSGDIRAVKNALKKIAQTLNVINAKLDYLISAVDKLPELVLAKIEQNEADLAYTKLESHYAVLKSVEDEYKLTHGEQVDVLFSISVIIDYECRPEKLLTIPFWCEFVRFVVPNVEAEIYRRLQEKLKVHRSVLAGYEQAMQTSVVAAEKAMHATMREPRGQHYFDLFADQKVSEAPPYFSYVINPAPIVLIALGSVSVPPGSMRPPVRGRMPHWSDNVASQEQIINSNRAQLSDARSKYDALWVATAMLDQYSEFLTKSPSPTEPPILQEVRIRRAAMHA